MSRVFATCQKHIKVSPYQNCEGCVLELTGNILRNQTKIDGVIIKKGKCGNSEGQICFLNYGAGHGEIWVFRSFSCHKLGRFYE